MTITVEEYQRLKDAQVQQQGQLQVRTGQQQQVQQVQGGGVHIVGQGQEETALC